MDNRTTIDVLEDAIPVESRDFFVMECLSVQRSMEARMLEFSKWVNEAFPGEHREGESFLDTATRLLLARRS